MEGLVRVKGFGTPELKAKGRRALARVAKLYAERYAPIRGSPGEQDMLARLRDMLEGAPRVTSLKPVGSPTAGPPLWAATPWFHIGEERGRFILLLPYASNPGVLEQPLAVLTRKRVLTEDIVIGLTLLEGTLAHPEAGEHDTFPQPWRSMAP